MALVFTQPISNSMDTYSVGMRDDSSNQCRVHLDAKRQCSCAADSNAARDRAYQRTRVRTFLLPVALVLLAVGATLVISCVSDINVFDFGGGSPLGKRQSSSSFTQNKLYLIILFVGLFLVVIAAILLSYWCCRGSFENPLCCPCYLCACCGGLACLECIGCGLCAAGLEAA